MKTEKYETAEEKLLYRKAMTVKEIIVYENNDAFPLCPRCGTSLSREFQMFCDRCGQKLSWKDFMKAKIRYLKNN